MTEPEETGVLILYITLIIAYALFFIRWLLQP